MRYCRCLPSSYVSSSSGYSYISIMSRRVFVQCPCTFPPPISPHGHCSWLAASQYRLQLLVKVIHKFLAKIMHQLQPGYDYPRNCCGRKHQRTTSAVGGTVHTFRRRRSRPLLIRILARRRHWGQLHADTSQYGVIADPGGWQRVPSSSWAMWLGRRKIFHRR